MKARGRIGWIVLAIAGLGLSVVAALLWPGRFPRGAFGPMGLRRPESAPMDEFLLREGLIPGRRAITGEVAPVPLPADATRPRNGEELAALVAWMRGFGHDELLRLSNAEYDFKASELVRMLQELEGGWVVKALGELALAEADPLLKAILVKGLAGSYSAERLADGELLPLAHALLGQMRTAGEDPHRVADDLVLSAWAACLSGGGDYAAVVGAHLAGADNGSLLTTGYLLLGRCPGSEAALKEMVTAHASAEGRMGALEGLRGAALDGRIPPGELTALGLGALAGETNERNRLLLYEMILAGGGEAGLGAIEELARAGDPAVLRQTVEMLAMKMEPARAMALFQDVLREQALDGETREAMYRALALVEGEEGRDVLLGLVNDPERDGAERLAGLRGLWNREVDEDTAAALGDLLANEEDPALRVEALRMLAYGEVEEGALDLREVAAADRDPSVRAEAVMLAAQRPAEDTGEDTGAWLEERLLQDDSLDVKAAALGALVYRAHYAGDGERVLDYLEQARRLTDDEEARAMIDQGEAMVRDYDPRRLDLGLAEEARFWTEIAGFTEGAARRSFERRGRVLEQMVGSLRAATGSARR